MCPHLYLGGLMGSPPYKKKKPNFNRGHACGAVATHVRTHPRARAGPVARRGTTRSLEQTGPEGSSEGAGIRTARWLGK